MTIGNENWSEFDWERELRKDDDRISSYMNELSKFIDLPNEEDIILKSLQNHSKPIPQIMNLSFEQDEQSDDIDSFEDDMFSAGDWRNGGDSIIYTIIEKMASQWSLYLASDIGAENQKQGMRILCYYGKILGRALDVLGVEAELPKNLRIALCKRIASCINELIGELNTIKEKQENLSKEIFSHSQRLKIVLEKVLDISEKLRTSS